MFSALSLPALRSLMLAAGVAAGALVTPHVQAFGSSSPTLQTVSSVDLQRFQGRWYQIAYYPNTFQRQCVANTTADYRLLMTGQVEVINTCGTADRGTSQVIGAARVKPPKFFGIPVAKGTDTSKLEVRFAPTFLAWLNAVWAPYWVIQLADDYRYAVISEPQQEFLWILSRTPYLDPTDRATINAKLIEQGFDLGRLVEEPQPGPWQ
ncbi:lipocalin family protein [Aquabacterium sp. A3]|uniref:lipocalin family protein n=1 Tax=Aquabacterium sp. A3 TaxID=3132829 RepID=UPI00311A503C